MNSLLIFHFYYYVNTLSFKNSLKAYYNNRLKIIPQDTFQHLLNSIWPWLFLNQYNINEVCFQLLLQKY